MSVVATKFWLIGMVVGDGYLSDRNIEIYNSSPVILKESVNVIKNILNFPVERIKVDVYSLDSNTEKWSQILELPQQCITLRKNTSPWNTTTEKIRIRISSKEKANELGKLLKNIRNASKEQKINFVKGLFDAEGSVDLKGRIEFKQVNDKKGKEITNLAFKIIANELKIRCTEPKIKQDKKKDDVYFYVMDIEKFSELVSFVDKEKREKLSMIIECSKSKKTPTESEILNSLEEPKTSFELIKTIKCPYYKIQRLLSKLKRNGQIKSVRRGRQLIYSTTL